MKKPKRNDPCPCGSGKKYKKCCGEDNVIAFNSSMYSDELERLHEQFIDFAFENFEDELKDIVLYFAADNINPNEEEMKSYTHLIIAWALFTAPLQEDKTLFDLFYAKAKNTIKYPTVKHTFAKWGDEMHPGVFEVFPNEENVKLIDIETGETFYTSLEEEVGYEQGDIAIGCLIPYTETHEFFMLMTQLPGMFIQEIERLIEDNLQKNLTIKEDYPYFIEDLFQLGSGSTMKWEHVDHEIVASIFQEHVIAKGYDEKLVQMAIQFWNDYCGMNDPIIRKHAGHAAALDYFVQADIMLSADFTQAQLAKEYETSAGTISNHYQRLSEDYELLFIDEDQESSSPTSFNMEKEMRNLTRLISEQEFDSDEELNDFMQEHLDLGEIAPPEHPRDVAQDILFDARETFGAARRRLINKALDNYPYSPDAYVLLAEDERSNDKRMELLEKANDVGKQDLGDEFFVANKGHFWGLIETRPFMRAKAMYATSLEKNGFPEKAMDVYQELLVLNPNDNQGIRYLLLPLYISLKRYDKADALIEDYGEATAVFMFSEALLHYERQGVTKKGLSLLKEATTNNPFVMDYLLGHKNIPSEISNYIGVGDETEAIAYVQENAHLWQDAVEFLKMV